MTPGSQERVELGRLSGPWGVAGWVKVFSHTRPPEAIFDYQPWLIEADGGTLEVAEWRRSGPRLVARVEGVDSREAAERLGRHALCVPRDRLPPAESGRYYWHDLIGMDVVNEQGHHFGRVRTLLDAGVHDVLVVDGAGGEVLIPFVTETFVRDVDPDRSRIRVEWPADWVNAE